MPGRKIPSSSIKTKHSASIIFTISLLFILEISKAYYKDWTDNKPVILLLQSSECWGYKCLPLIWIRNFHWKKKESEEKCIENLSVVPLDVDISVLDINFNYAILSPRDLLCNDLLSYLNFNVQFPSFKNAPSCTWCTLVIPAL